MSIPAAVLPTPPGCTAFPARGGYPESWTLHLVAVDGATQDHRAVRGTNASQLNDEAAAAMEHGATVYAWVDSSGPERCQTCGRLMSATALLPCRCFHD